MADCIYKRVQIKDDGAGDRRTSLEWYKRGRGEIFRSRSSGEDQGGLRKLLNGIIEENGGFRDRRKKTSSGSCFGARYSSFLIRREERGERGERRARTWGGMSLVLMGFTLGCSKPGGTNKGAVGRFSDRKSLGKTPEAKLPQKARKRGSLTAPPRIASSMETGKRESSATTAPPASLPPKTPSEEEEDRGKRRPRL